MKFNRLMNLFLSGAIIFGFCCRDSKIRTFNEEPASVQQVQQVQPIQTEPKPIIKTILPYSSIKRQNSELVKILSKDYESQVLADDLLGPRGLAFNPSNNHLYFGQRDIRYKGLNEEEAYQLWKRNGDDLYVYELTEDGIKIRFEGTTDPWGGYHGLNLTINKDVQLFLYEHTGKGDGLRVYNTESGKEELDLFNRGGYIYINGKLLEGYTNDRGIITYPNYSFPKGDFFVNPADKKLYLISTDYFSIKSNCECFDPETKSFKQIPSSFEGFLFGFDTRGNLYSVFYGGNILSINEKTSHEITIYDKNHNKTERLLQGPREMIYGSDKNGFLQFQFGKVDNTSGSLLGVSTSNLSGIDMQSGKLFKIAEVSNSKFEFRGLDVDNQGNIYLMLDNTNFKDNLGLRNRYGHLIQLIRK